jgi:hypothetical protein
MRNIQAVFCVKDGKYGHVCQSGTWRKGMSGKPLEMKEEIREIFDCVLFPFGEQ